MVEESESEGGVIDDEEVDPEPLEILEAGGK